ncbi:PorT family protein [Sphingobacterium alkalisoli]|uniref:PorT family protein n=1 Tax=Sphingobacterium alkalisoli TaxID=1874115 RepID=A0A4V5LXH5_9SPHI|nr:porin family protein [Sphingobacterium alkalisoli]TJY62589.1 PorT family protein [Sphingobacterium alkalisoli]GGH27630.1 hypothetical protein GCM10011418_37680 [Sphingobacterium alkalisoli]
MKKTCLAVAALLCSAGLYAQSSFGIKGGLNLASEYARMDNQSSTTKILPSFHVGAYYDARVSSGFSIQPGVLLQGKGGRFEDGGETLSDKFLYLEVPINFLGRVSAGSGEVFFGGGPYLAYGLSAKVTSGRSSIHMEWGSQPNQLNRFDAGLGFLAGYRFFNGLVLSLNSTAGFINMSNLDATFQNRVSSISIGYEFGTR